MKNLEADLPRIFLNRAQWLRLALVGTFVAFVLGRAVPDLVRVVYPLNVFGYVTDGNGAVIAAHEAAQPAAARTATPRRRPPAIRKAHPEPPAPDTIDAGDVVRIDRIKVFDRKPGLAGAGYTYDNPDRHLPVERGGRLRILHLVAHAESGPSRFLAALRIVLFIVSVGLGAILFLVKPSLATGAFFFFCIGADTPTTYLDLVTPNPWRQIPEWIGDTLRGSARPALLLFALCLIDGVAGARRERALAAACAVLGLALGTVGAYGSWLLTYRGVGAAGIDGFSSAADDVVTALTIVAFVVAFVRAGGVERARIGWMVGAFVFAAGAQLISDAFFPRYLPFWLNGLLVSTAIVPVAAVWIAVIRQRFFNVDFVVSRAIVYTALTAAAFGAITVTEEVGTYIFYNNTDITYGVMIFVSLGIGSLTGKINPFLQAIVDKFIFRNRLDQRRALEFIEGYILDAETREDVFRALLSDATHALSLSFGGFLARLPDGDYALSYEHGWPADCIRRLDASDELTQKITRTRGAFTMTGKDTALIARAFPGERLTFAAPLYFNRSVLGIVMYGHNVSGLDLDPEEREHLVRVVAHASIALSSIELERYRQASTYDPALIHDVRAV